MPSQSCHLVLSVIGTTAITVRVSAVAQRGTAGRSTARERLRQPGARKPIAIPISGALMSADVVAVGLCVNPERYP